MRQLAHLIHDSIRDSVGDQSLKVLAREAARGIVLRDNKVLLMYTERYDDFSFPGGGMDPGEQPVVALRREMAEEAGAHGIEVITDFGKVTEYLPCWKPAWDLMFQTSYLFHCRLTSELQASRLEHYEISNGMQVQWVDIKDAINHNLDVMHRRPQNMGIAVHRETHVLRQVASELLDAGEL